MLVFGGRIVHAHENLSEGQIGEIAADQVSKRGPQELEAAAAAAAAAEEQRLLLERLQERRNTLRKQIENLKYAGAPNLTSFAGAIADEPSEDDGPQDPSDAAAAAAPSSVQRKQKHRSEGRGKRPWTAEVCFTSFESLRCSVGGSDLACGYRFAGGCDGTQTG